MRSSSLKSTLAVFSLVVTLAAAAPMAHAKPSQTPRETSIYSTIQRLLKRFLGPVANALPSVPIPLELENSTSTQPIGAAPKASPK
jgi:type IV secretory pathway VirB2 component (pilin)